MCYLDPGWSRNYILYIEQNLYLPVQEKTEHLSKVVTTAQEANSIFAEFHSSNIGRHCGVQKTTLP